MCGASCRRCSSTSCAAGPGLGGILPSQADYFQATKGGGHGDCRLLVMAPASVQEASRWSCRPSPGGKIPQPGHDPGRRLIGQMMEPVEFPDHLKSEPSNKDAGPPTAWTPRQRNAQPGQVPLSGPEVLNDHNLKLKAKYERMAREEIRFEPYNTDGDYQVLIVSYGTMSRVCKTAIDNAQGEGDRGRLLRPRPCSPSRRRVFARRPPRPAAVPSSASR
jgi:2-oxoglutarate/2-oxoacid ferredoxin oxidoreductase subunit alpha